MASKEEKFISYIMEDSIEALNSVSRMLCGAIAYIGGIEDPEKSCRNAVEKIGDAISDKEISNGQAVIALLSLAIAKLEERHDFYEADVKTGETTIKEELN